MSENRDTEQVSSTWLAQLRREYRQYGDACAVLQTQLEQRDVRIAELESVLYAERIDADDQRRELNAATQNLGGLRAELAAIKAQEPVQVDYVAVMRADGEGGLEPEWLLEGGTAELMNGMYLCCLGGGSLLFEGGHGQLYAATSVSAEQQGVIVPHELLIRVLEPVTSEQYINSKHELCALMNAATPAPSTTEGQGDE